MQLRAVNFYWNWFQYFLLSFCAMTLGCAMAYGSEIFTDKDIVPSAKLVSKELKPAEKASVKKAVVEVSKSEKKADALKGWFAKKTPKKEPFSSYKLPEISLEEQKEPSYTRYLKGRISNKSAYGMAVVYGSDPALGELESWNNFTKKMKLDGFKKLSDLEEGDTVEITYKQLIKSNKRLLTGVSLVHKLTREERAAEEKALEETTDENTVPAVTAAAAKPISKEMANGTAKIL